MNEPTPKITVEQLTSYRAEDATAIGKLLPHLSQRFDDAPVAEALLREIIDSPTHAQFVVRSDGGQIVGLATLSMTLGVAAGRNAWLDDFVVDTNLRGAGVGGALWQALIDWCEQNQLGQLGFTSNHTRQAAHRFYLARGAEIRDTAYFRKMIN